MALTAVNPQIISTPSPIGLARVSYVAEDSKTWKKGEFCYLTSGTVTPCTTTTGSSLVLGTFAEDQDDVTASSEEVWVNVLEVGTELLMFITNNGSATGASEADATIGTAYEAYTANNVAYIDLNATTTPQFKVMNTWSLVNEEQASYQGYNEDTEPGMLYVKFILASAT